MKNDHQNRPRDFRINTAFSLCVLCVLCVSKIIFSTGSRQSSCRLPPRTRSRPVRCCSTEIPRCTFFREFPAFFFAEPKIIAIFAPDLACLQKREGGSKEHRWNWSREKPFVRPTPKRTFSERYLLRTNLAHLHRLLEDIATKRPRRVYYIPMSGSHCWLPTSFI